MPLPQTGTVVLVVLVDVELVVVELVELVLVELVVAVAQPPASQASQQLGTLPAHPPVARQRTTELLMVQRGWSCWIRQQVVAPGRPHVDRRAQRSAGRRHSRGKRIPATRARRTPAAHRTYVACVRAPSQSHADATAALASARADASTQSAARAGATPIPNAKIASTIRMTPPSAGSYHAHCERCQTKTQCSTIQATADRLRARSD